MARGDQLGRQWKIIQTLLQSHRGCTVNELADRLECHSRSVYRDLQALEFAGFPLYCEREDGANRWLILDRAKHQMPLPLNLTELMALYFGRGLLRALENTFFHEAIESLFQKLKATLPQDYMTFLKQIENSLQVGRVSTGAPLKAGNYLAELNQAILDRRWVTIDYHSMGRNEVTRRKVAPYKLWFCNGIFYLIAYCGLREEVRTFVPQRIRSLTITEQEYEIPEHFSPEDMLAKSFGIFQGEDVRVRIRFSAAVAGYIKERTWHPSQQITAQDDGSVIFEAQVAGLDEIKYWILRWGAQARVLAPKELQATVRSEAQRMLAHYVAPDQL